MLRQVDPEGVDKFTAGFSLAGRIKTFGKDDFRFQINEGELGRYVVTTAARDVYKGEVEETSSFNLGYRHFWSSNWRSTLLYGETETNEQGTDRSQYGITLLTDLTPSLTVGIEYGKYQDNEEFIEGMVAISVPILTQENKLVACLFCHAPTVRQSVASLEAHLPLL